MKETRAKMMNQKYKIKIITIRKEKECKDERKMKRKKEESNF